VLVNKKIKLSQIVAIVIPVLALFPLISENIIEKIFGQYMGSGMTRFSDFFTGLYLLYENPIIGAPQIDAVAANNSDLIPIKTFFWSGNFYDGAYDAYLTVPNTNGYMIFLLDWGLIFGLILLLSTFKTGLFPDKKLNVLTLLLIYISMSAEPISNTTFFYSFIVFGLLKSLKRPNHAKEN
jgi:hypothetical protein